MNILRKKDIYLDNAACTMVDLNIVKKINKIEKKLFANSSGIHKMGLYSLNVLNESRISVARNLNAHKDEIFFAGSGTESVAIAILGTIYNFHEKNPNSKILPHIITSNIEHSAVIENCRLLEKRKQAEITYIACDENGIVNPKDIKKALKENTILVSIMYANNEIGTIQPIQEIAKEIRYFKKNRNIGKDIATEEHGYFSTEKFLVLEPSLSQVTSVSTSFPVLHTDACQAMNYLFTENIEKLGVDMMSFNSSKIYGGNGIGCLYKKRSVEISPVYGGGGQENNLRSGTENVAGVLGLSLALEITNKIKDKESARLIKIRDYAIEESLSLSVSSGYEIILNGSKENRLPNNINISVFGISSELLVIELDAKGIMVSERSACASDQEGSSHVIRALRSAQNKKVDETSGALRITLGRQTIKKDIDTLVKNLSQILEKYKKWK